MHPLAIGQADHSAVLCTSLSVGSRLKRGRRASSAAVDCLSRRAAGGGKLQQA